MQRRKDANENQRVNTPFQNVVMEEEKFKEDDEIHCMEDKGSASFLTLTTYEESLFKDQTSQEWVVAAVLQTKDRQRYNLRSKMNNAKETPIQRTVVPAM